VLDVLSVIVRKLAVFSVDVRKVDVISVKVRKVDVVDLCGWCALRRDGMSAFCQQPSRVSSPHGKERASGVTATFQKSHHSCNADGASVVPSPEPGSVHTGDWKAFGLLAFVTTSTTFRATVSACVKNSEIFFRLLMIRQSSQ
jgi:hypothetical protein